MPYWIDPLTDSRWTEFIEKHPSSSVFHTTGWIRALARTYGFRPAAITSSPPETPLENAIPFCFVISFLTGRRLSSLPFSDHCQPLADRNSIDSLLSALIEYREKKQYKYLELRPLTDFKPKDFAPSQKFIFHSLDLHPTTDKLFQQLHRDCVRRKIRRATREGLITEAGTSKILVNEFFKLQLHTRRKHGLPPQPKRWFQNLVKEMQGNATIRVARHRGQPVASILTLRHKKTVTYKYGCSEADDNNLGGMQLLLWQAIEDAKAAEMESLDLGRCDLSNEGLAVFKERWGAERREISYLRYPNVTKAEKSFSLAHTLFSKLPDPILEISGRILYRHFA